MRRVPFRAAFGVALALLVAQPPAWTFAELLRPPSPDELRLVDESWARKSWKLDGTSRIGTTTVPVGSLRFDAHLYSFNLNGSPRCGAVLLPSGAVNLPLAGLVDIGDIRWDYPDRDLTNGPYVAGILGERTRDFALIVPCARGMGLRVGQLASRAGGDRRDAWEGAAEDAMAELAQVRFGFDVPDLYAAIFSVGGQQPAVRREGHAVRLIEIGGAFAGTPATEYGVRLDFDAPRGPRRAFLPGEL